MAIFAESNGGMSFPNANGKSGIARPDLVWRITAPRKIWMYAAAASAVVRRTGIAFAPAPRCRWNHFEVKKAMEEASRLYVQLDELMESGFGGAEADRVKNMVEEVALQEHEADVIQRRLLKTMLAREEDFTYGEFFLWTRIIQQVADLSNLAEKVGNMVRMTLEIK